MPYRTMPFVTGEIYHVFNRSIARQPIFNNYSDYDRLIQLINYYKFGKLPLRFSYYQRLSKELKEEFAENYLLHNEATFRLLTYCIMPNHFHFLISPRSDNTLSDFMRNIQNAYSKYFNLKYERTGSLFQSMFKAVRIETDEQLLHVSRYIHINPTTDYLIHRAQLENYQWSSLPEYVSDHVSVSMTDTEIILNFFKSRDAYKEFVYDQIEYQRELSKIKHLTFDYA